MNKTMNNNVFAVIIGVGDYEKMGMANLSTYKMDISMMLMGLRSGLKVPDDNIRILAGEDNNGNVTTTALAYAIADFDSKLGSEDVFIFYFSGHGREKNIIFSNGQVELQSIIDYIEKIPAKSRLVILDCCYSGNFEGSGARIMHFDDAVSDFAGKGIAVLASSAADEVSRLGLDGKSSMFTGALASNMILRLKPHKGKVSLDDIYDGTMELVKSWNNNNPGKEQQPIFRSSIGGTIYFQIEEYHPYRQMEVQYDEED